MLPQDQKSMVTIQSWLDGFPEEFQKWYRAQTKYKFKSWFAKKTSPKFKKSFASSSEDNRDWFVEEAGTKFFQWYSEYAEWFETYDVSCSRQKQPTRLQNNTVNIARHHHRI